MFASAKEKQQKKVRQLQCQKNSALIISHIAFRDCRVHICFRRPFSKQMYTEFQVVCTCMIFNHILIFTIKSNSFKKAIRRGHFYPGYHTFFLACGDCVRRCFGIGYPFRKRLWHPAGRSQPFFKSNSSGLESNTSK